MNTPTNIFPESLKLRLQRIRKKIETSSGCGYLYHHFDDLISDLEKWHLAHPCASDHKELVDTVDKFIEESTYRPYGSPGWLMYSARCFFCAHSLLRYVHQSVNRVYLQKGLMECFLRLLNTEVVTVIDDALLKAMIVQCQDSSEKQDVYKRVIERSIETSKMHRPFDSGCEYVAYMACLRAMDFIKIYLGETGDYSVLKTWIPKLDTPRLADIWYEFPERYIRSWEHHRHLVESVQGYLDKSLDAHLELWGTWLDYDISEAIELTSAEDLIEVLEVMDDDDFCDVLNRAVRLPYSDKVIAILNHFTDDDEYWVVALSKLLLSQYKIR